MIDSLAPCYRRRAKLLQQQADLRARRAQERERARLIRQEGAAKPATKRSPAIDEERTFQRIRQLFARAAAKQGHQLDEEKFRRWYSEGHWPTSP